MDLHRVSRKFDHSLFVDYFNVGTSFYGQVNPYTEGVRSAAPTRRRILSTAPGVIIPSSRLVTTNGHSYIVGSQSPDYHRGTVIRNKYALAPVDSFFSVKTLPQFLSGAVGTANVGTMLYLADVVVTTFDRYFRVPKYELFFSTAHVFSHTCLFTNGSELFLTVTESGVDGVGINMIEAIDVSPSASRNVTVSCISSRDLVSEVVTPVTYNNVPALVVYARYSFEFLSGDNKEIEPGDNIAWLPKSVVVVPPKEGSTVDGKKVVAYREDPAGVWRVLLRIS